MASLGRIQQRRPRADTTVLRQFTVLFLIALTLLVGRDAPPIQEASRALTQVLVPFERALTGAGTAVTSFTEAVSAIQQLREENARLQRDIDQLTIENVRLREAAIAAEQAAQLEAAGSALPYESVAAPIIARDPSGILHTVMLGAGTDQGVQVGHIVVSERGLVGRVTQAGPTYSKVLLVTDPASTVSAIVQGSRATGIVRGQYGDTLVMEWILQNDDLKAGDVVITAGLALGNDLRSLFPKGLVIGTVVAIDRSENAAYERAIVTPAADIRRLEHVLVVKTD
ncbi:MAG: rod shape-determining protein MreC [Chloroflexi bacterium RIFCSPLOWO2_12_FULL_71_12]|nr:MAG: rod shape-determining protein MreC [Chloroflexi bacterium RIFCSPLOWO2_02_FULL_71_16]OGO73444.1 MAG: rod shape-determining protein MreC [Chloroflexi bacterium RIFCSPLOWO2_12_FULL_71_12]